MGGTPVIEEDPDVVVEWVSWEGRPPGQEFAGYSPEQKQESYENNHKPLAEKYNVPIRVAGGDYRTTNLHMATYYARDKGKFKEFRNRCYKARWEDDLNLEDLDIIAGLGEDVGGVVSILSQLAPQPHQVGADHVGVARIVPAPHSLQQMIVGKGGTGVGGQFG